MTDLHNGCVLPDPLVERGGKLFKLLELGLGLGIEQRVAGGRLGEHIVQLGDVGDDGLLVWFGGINIYKEGVEINWCRDHLASVGSSQHFSEIKSGA